MEIIGALLLIAMLATMTIAAFWFSRKRSRTWKVVAEGQFSFARFDKRLKTIAGGMYGACPIYANVAEIHFYDGTHLMAWDVGEIPCSRGDRIRVLENNFGECRIEKVEDTTKSRL